MKRLNINNFKFVKNIDSSIYICESKNGEYTFKRILEDELIIIRVHDNIVSCDFIKNRRKINNYSNLEKEIIFEDIFNNLKNSILKDFLDLDKIKEIVSNSYIKIHYCNDYLGLSIVNDSLINVVLLDSNSIIGKIILDGDVNIDVNDNYLKDSLVLLNNYLKNKKAKKLVLI